MSLCKKSLMLYASQCISLYTNIIVILKENQTFSYTKILRKNKLLENEIPTFTYCFQLFKKLDNL